MKDLVGEISDAKAHIEKIEELMFNIVEKGNSLPSKTLYSYLCAYVYQANYRLTLVREVLSIIEGKNNEVQS